MLSFFSITAPEPNQEIETFEHFWLGTISLLTPNAITPNVISSK